MKRVLFCLTLCASLAFASGQPSSNLFTIESQPAGWTIRYSHVPVPTTTVEINGVPHTSFVGTGKEGEPRLPVQTVTLGIPFDAAVTATLSDAVYETVGNQNIAPVPLHEITAEQEAIEIWQMDASAYSRNSFFPWNALEIGAPHLLRHQRAVTIRLRPYRYNPATKTLQYLVSAKINVHMTSSGTPNERLIPAPDDPQFEQMYRSLVANHAQAKQWRRVEVRQPMRGPDPTRDWFETGRTYYRIKIAEDAWYKVTLNDLALAGANTSNIDTASFKMFARGVEIPIVVRPDSSVEFFAVRNSGDSTWFDFYSDTSHYWLTWGGIPGRRYQGVVIPATDTLTIRGSNVTRHFEQNTGYFQGTTQTEIIQNGPVSGEGWRWDLFFPNTNLTKNFVLDSLFTAGDTLANVRVRFFGTTVDSPGLDHRARFWINDSLVGETSFEARTGETFSSPFPMRWLVNGTNRLRIQSIPTGNPINQFYLDWFEVDFARMLSAASNQLIINVPTVPSPVPMLYSTGFTSPDIEVFDRSSGRQILGGVVTGDSISGYAVTFTDSVSIQRKYAVVVSAKSVGPLEPKVFTDIRMHPTGADYVVITHENFKSSAQQLASHRQVQNGVRSTVVDVLDIYDEFNYGVENWTILKDFLEFAYRNWTAPAPSHLVLFGDACWDNHHYLASTIKTNFVPAYGLPAGDNWFGCFDSASQVIPSLLIGRLPVEDSIQAQRLVSKIIGYDSYTLEEWNKNFLMITGGTTPGEQTTFNNRSEASLNAHVLPAPIGGSPFRVYKSTDAVIDGENKPLLRSLVANGLVFMNFLGHSGGRIWGVDIGSPYDLENTNGKLPFVSSVSCNVGAFAEPSNNVLGEDFVLADNRGAIASWASSSLGYPTPGWLLMNNFLMGVTADSMRAFGALTSSSRYRLWLGSPDDPIIRAMVNLNPLLGDPLSRLAIPMIPDFSLSSSDIKLDKSMPTPVDSALGILLRVHNWGLVPADSIELQITDAYSGQMLPVATLRISPTRHRDSLLVPWDALNQVGRHSLLVAMDAQNAVAEVNEFNNSTSSDQYIYASSLAVVKPLNNQVVSPGQVALVVTSPSGRDSAGFQYHFELDTVATFDSQFLVSSGPVLPSVVKGEWVTPALDVDRVYFWRCRTAEDTLYGNWVSSCFSTSIDYPALPEIRLGESAAKQFSRDVLNQVMPTDSGITIVSTAPLQLFCRSLSYRANLNLDYYSIIKVNSQTMTGYWWVLGRSFMVARVNEFTGEFNFRSFDVAGQAAQADSMARFINNTPSGNYLAMSVIFDGRTNVNESLYVAIESLGSTMIRSVTNGRAWVLIGRKGFPGVAAESMTNDSAMVSMQVPNYYGSAIGSISTLPISIPQGWDSLKWAPQTNPGVTDAGVEIWGVRSNGVTDTLKRISSDSLAVDLSWLGTLTSGPTYESFKLAGFLSSSDALYTPVLKSWHVDIVAGVDLAVSSQSLGANGISVQRGEVFDLPVAIYNIGFQDADSARIVVSVYDKYNKARPIAYAMSDSIPVGGSKVVTVPIATENFPRHVTLQVAISPSKKAKDLVAENNIAYFGLDVAGVIQSGLQIFADGLQLMDGDHVSATPAIIVRTERIEPEVISVLEFFVDGIAIPVGDGGLSAKGSRSTQKILTDGETLFLPSLSEGRHQIESRLITQTRFGDADTSSVLLAVSVTMENQILNVFNYPNPFSSNTEFTFTLTGADVPEEVSIRVFTVTGRKIREIWVSRSALRIGFNRVVWDGRDVEGDEIANGYYFYQVAAKGPAGEPITATQKLVKVR